ncbi:MAG: hypothetical protein AB7P69_16530, partial [Candidatus Binatia bacterium]
MQKKQLLSVALLVAWTLSGCESAESTDRIAKLQEQIGRLAQQLTETQKQVDGLQEANQRSVRSLEELETTVERLTLPSPAPLAGKTLKGDASTTALSPAKSSQSPLIEQDVASSPQRQRKSGDALTAKVTPLMPPATGESNQQLEEPESATRKETEATVVAGSCG